MFIKILPTLVLGLLVFANKIFGQTLATLATLALKKDSIAQRKILIAQKRSVSARLDLTSARLDLPPRLSDFLLSDRACSATTDEIFAKASPFVSARLVFALTGSAQTCARSDYGLTSSKEIRRQTING